MAQLSETSRSHVKTLSHRKLGASGIMHDQVWFPVSVNKVSDIFGKRIPSKPGATPIERIDGQWYELYLDRRMIWCKWFGFRWHTFYQGDDDSAPHDHPWWFMTIPFSGYDEMVRKQKPSPFPWYDWRKPPPGDHPRYWVWEKEHLTAWIPRFRAATHRHFVLEPKKPFRTLIVHGRLIRDWGFWPEDNAFVPHRDWATYDRATARRK